MENLSNLASLLKQRNTVAKQITAIIERPAQIGHIGEFIASHIFGISLAESAVQRGSDGVFKSGLLSGKTVNIKWYAKRENLLDIRQDALPDYFLVLTGPKAKTMTSRGEVRPWCIESVYLFEAHSLCLTLEERGVKIGIATSVVKGLWEMAEIYPGQRSDALLVTDEQRNTLRMFGPELLC